MYWIIYHILTLIISISKGIDHLIHDDNTQSFVGSSILGLTVFIGLDTYIAMKLLNFILGCFSALFFGWLGMVGKDLYPIMKEQYKIWKIKRGK